MGLPLSNTEVTTTGTRCLTCEPVYVAVLSEDGIALNCEGVPGVDVGSEDAVLVGVPEEGGGVKRERGELAKDPSSSIRRFCKYSPITVNHGLN